MKRILFIVFLLAAAGSPCGADTFGPWQRDVIVGDQAVVNIQKNAGHRHHHSSSVFSGFQGGGWILIRFFQVVISPLDGPSCRYFPVCSVYGRQAVERYGSLVGAIMAGERILRCNPWGSGGYDPVRPLSSGE